MTSPRGGGLTWIKSSRSMASDACVELANDGEHIALRHSKKPDVEIRYSRKEIDAFLHGAKKGEFDHLIE